MRSVKGTVLHLLLSAVAVVALAGAPVPAKSGAAMCALTPADFHGVGVSAASAPTANVQDDGASVYCVYAGKSSATGGIELDVFHPAGASIADARETLRFAIGEGTSGLTPIALAGADEAQWSAATTSGGPAFAVLAARRGTLVFVLGIPSGANARMQLMQLAAILLQRV